MPKPELAYDFEPAPRPIYASADRSNLNLVSLTVTVTNSTDGPITLSKIEIQIPVGADVDGDISSAPNLPAPVFDANTNISMTSTGSTVTIQTMDGTPLTISVTAQIIFSLPDITVNTLTGRVPITITEFPGGDKPKRSDDTTYSLKKERTTWPVTRFWAEPPALNNLDQTVQLKWSCNNLGPNYSYSLSAPDWQWQPKDCLNSGDCYDVQDGVNGVTSLALTDTTKFILTVVQTRNGVRIAVGTLETTVPISQPKIMGKSPAVYFGGSVARLYWLATNASRCAVTLNGVALDANAPMDTWKKGYLVKIAGEGQQSFQVTATAVSGQAAVFTCPSFVTTNKAQRVIAFPPEWATKNFFIHIGIAPDGQVALLSYVAPFSKDCRLSVIDVEKRTFSLPDAIRVPQLVGPLAVSPNGDLALVTSAWNDSDPGIVSVIDLAKHSVRPPAIHVGRQPSAIAISPDGKLALVMSFMDNNLTVIDMSTLTPHSQPIPWGGTAAVGPIIAITHDGKLALVARPGSKDLMVIDIPQYTVRPSKIPIGGSPLAIAIAPDGKLALVVRNGLDDILVVEIPNLTVRPSPIAVKAPLWVLITPDSQLALVGSFGLQSSLTVIDMSTLRPLPTPIIVDQEDDLGAQAMAITADGKLVVVRPSGLSVL
jgi:DNA-binding beta-propeller fold protein YncE